MIIALISVATSLCLLCLVARLFEDHGELLLLFNKFRELKTKEQQASSEELGEHANKVMETLDEGIRSLDELDTFFDYLHQVGASHTRIPDFKSEHFWVSERLWRFVAYWFAVWNKRKICCFFLLISMLFLFFSLSLSRSLQQKIEKPFLSAVQNTLGDRYTENVEGIYKLTIKFIIETLITGFESANSKSNTSAVNNNSNSTTANAKSWE